MPFGSTLNVLDQLLVQMPVISRHFIPAMLDKEIVRLLYSSTPRLMIWSFTHEPSLVGSSDSIERFRHSIKHDDLVK